MTRPEPISHSELPGFQGLVGVSKFDITPALDVPLRNWGAAPAERATGIHRPLEGRAVCFQSVTGGEPLVWVSLNLGWWKSRQAELEFRQQVASAFPWQPERLIIHLTHSHAGPTLMFEEMDSSSAEAIQAYRTSLVQAVRQGILGAMESRKSARLSWRYGYCGLASNRDLRDPLDQERYVCAWNPEAVPDRTLLVGRVTDDSDQVFAVLVNYACHPTTLAWENQLVSPDYVGELEATVETGHPGSICVFIQGASGELAPRIQYVADGRIADQHGRELGYAVLSILAGMLGPGRQLEYSHSRDSCARLGIWRECPVSYDGSLDSVRLTVPFPLKEDLPEPETLDEGLRACTDPLEREKLLRLRSLRSMFGEQSSSREEIHLWTIGGAVLCAHPFEAYSALQTVLRNRFPGIPIIAANICNGWRGYLPEEKLYGLDLYSAIQSPFAPGGLELLIETFSKHISKLYSNNEHRNPRI